MLYYVKNKSGNVSDVTERIYNRLVNDDEYECWTEDPYESLPDEIPKSTDYTVREIQDMTSDMNDADIRAFISEDEDRKSVLKLIK